MWLSAATLALLVVTTTLMHYEVLRGLGIVLPRLSGPPRAKLVIVILATFVSHVAQIALYGVGFLPLVRILAIGGLTGSNAPSLMACLYFSAETYTSLGFGDIIPTGAARLLAGGEALNGLLLIGWSASYTYISMERFWCD